MLKRFVYIAATLAAVIPLTADGPENVQLMTLAPAGTSWHLALQDMGAAWKKDTGDRVRLTIFAGGSAGDESTSIKKMRTGIIQASFLSSVGLAELDEAFNVFGMPFFIETPEEEAAIEKKLAPIFEKRLEAKGLHLLCWGSGGWVQLFSKKPLHNLAEVKGAKLYTTKGADKMREWYVQNHFNPKSLLPGEVQTELKNPNGQIDTAPYPPYLAAALSVFRDAPYMLDLRVAPMVGALVITQASWNRITPADREKVTAAAQAMEARVRREAPQQDAESIKAMSAKVLKVITPDKKALDEFRATGSELVASMRGWMVPADIYDMAVQERDAVRKSKGK